MNSGEELFPTVVCHVSTVQVAPDWRSVSYSDERDSGDGTPFNKKSSGAFSKTVEANNSGPEAYKRFHKAYQHFEFCTKQNHA